VLYEVLIFVFADVLKITKLGGTGPPFSFLALLHVLLWLVVMIFHFLLGLQHHHLQLRGYLRFCHSIKNLKMIPPLVLTFGNSSRLPLCSYILVISYRNDHELFGMPEYFAFLQEAKSLPCMMRLNLPT
jgi:hypothetical protein